MSVPRVLWVIPLSAVVIAGLVTYRLARPPEPASSSTRQLGRPYRQAPLFHLMSHRRLNNSRELVRFERYVSRHKLLVAFIGEGSQPGPGSLVRQLETMAQDVQKLNGIILVIGGDPPSVHESWSSPERPFPFHILSDIGQDTKLAVHRSWGAYDTHTDRPRQAVFIVDRARIIAHSHIEPEDLGTPEQWLQELRSAR